MGIERMIRMGCNEIVLEAEVFLLLLLLLQLSLLLCLFIIVCLINKCYYIQATNKGALTLYEKLGFVRDEKLTRYYLNGNDAFRLKLWIDIYNDDKEEETDKLIDNINNKKIEI
jgi:peptide alpha-N-acetyltransferase